MTRIVPVVAAGAAAVLAGVLVARTPVVLGQTPRGGAYVAYYWRAKPGQTAAYTEYIRKIAEPIDADAQHAGAFLDVRTVTPAPGTPADWTHLRIFHVSGLEAANALGAALDAATVRVVPDESARNTNSARAAGLRDFVRQEIWTDLR